MPITDKVRAVIMSHNALRNRVIIYHNACPRAVIMSVPKILREKFCVIVLHALLM